MSDKSPRQSMSNKSVKSIKEKRTEKRAKGADDAVPDRLQPPKRK